MSSKFLLAIVAVALLGCDLKLNEKPPAPEVKEFKTEDCLSNTVPSIKNFFKGQASDAEVGTTWDCMGTAVNQFRKYVRGGQSDRFTPQELATFLEKNFLDDDGRKISPALQAEVMKIKRVLIGGSTDVITLTEVDRLLDLINVLRRHSLTMNPFMKIISQNWIPGAPLGSDANENELKDAQETLISTLQQLGGIFQDDYDVAGLPTLVNEAVALFPNEIEDPEGVKKTVLSYTLLVSDVKNMVYSEKDTLLHRTTLPSLIRVAGDAYTAYLYEIYFVKDQGVSRSESLQSLDKFINRLLVWGKGVLKIKKSHQLTIPELKVLVDRIVPLEILPDSLDAETLKPLVSVVLKRVLTPPDQRIMGNLSQVLNQRSLDLAAYEWKSWIELEKFTAAQFINGGETYSAASVQQLYADKFKEENLSPALATGLKEMIMALDTPIPMALDAEERLIVADRDRPYNRAALKQVNLNRTIARIFMRAYVNDLARLQDYSGIVLSEAQTAYAELKPLAVSLGVIDADNTSFANSRFREANMFVARANGDTLVSFQEGVDLISMIWSGLNIHAMFKEDLQNSCLSAGMKVKSDTLVDKVCMEQIYYARMATYMSSMPYFAQFIQAIPEAERAKYFDNVLKSAGFIPNPANKVKMGDASLFPHVVQYIEMAYTRFDANRDGLFSTPEALNAFPCFRNIIATLANGQVGPDEYDDIFTYILKNGKPPETIQEKLKYAVSWRNKPDNWNLTTDRVLLAKILGYIADQMAKQPTAAAGTAGTAMITVTAGNYDRQEITSH